MPIFIPTAKALGIDLVHFGVVVVVNIMIGLLTPPYGLLLFVLANMTKQPLMRDRARSRAVHLRCRSSFSRSSRSCPKRPLAAAAMGYKG